MRKFLPYIFILTILAGIFSPFGSANADPAPQCPGTQLPTTPSGTTPPCATRGDACTTSDGKAGIWTGAGTLACSSNVENIPGVQTPATPTNPSGQTAFQNEIDKHVCFDLTNFTIGGCAIQVSYLIFYTMPSFLLRTVAGFFDVMINLTLNSELISGSKFIPEAWGIVRDLSNLFFIIILLYIAIQLILGLGGHDTKKMIITVIIMALLINFSMFFTEVVIDTSNTLALVFYNKLSVTNKDGEPISTLPVSKFQEKNVSAAMVNSFDPTVLLKQPFFDNMRQNGQIFIPGTLVQGALLAFSPIVDPTNAAIFLGYYVPSYEVPTSTILALIFISAAIMFFAIYCFMVASISFLARLIEMWILIIFSPFAFMSFALPSFAHVEYIAWDSWSKRLLKVSFMAPIFMFFLYFIFLLLHANIFEGLKNPGDPGKNPFVTIIFIVIPAGMVLILLLKATEFAKKGSGVIGEKLMQGAKVVGGLALGAATGGAALLATNTLGRVGANLAESNKLRDAASKDGIGGWAARRALSTSNKVGTGSWDLRKTGLGSLAKKGGINLESSKSIGLGSREGGFSKARVESAKKEEEWVKKTLDTSEYGKAELSRGNMNVNRAADLVDRMEQGAGRRFTNAERIGYQMQLTHEGIQTQDLGRIASYLDAARRNSYADLREKRAAGWTSAAKARSGKKRMVANRIRKGASTLQESRSVAHALEHLAHELHGQQPAHPPAAAPAAAAAAHPPAAPDPGGGAPAAAAHPHP